MEPPTGGRARNEVVDGYGTEKMPSRAARIRDERGFGRFPIIDAEAHHCESESNAEVADDDPRAAAKTAERILGAVERSGDFPASGRPGRLPRTRELVVPGTPVILPRRVNGEAVEILGVFFHTSRIS